MSLIGNPLVSTNYQTDTFSGNGSTVAFTLSVAPASVASIAVYISGLYQTPGSAYTISGTTITFTGAPPAGTNNILVLHLGVRSSTLVPVAQSLTPAMLNNANVIYWSTSNTNVGIGNTAPNAPLTIGSANGTFSNPLVQAAGNANSWVQISGQNLNNGNNASTDMVLARSDGNDTSGFIDIGINSNTYSQAAYSLMTPNSGYLFTNGGDLFLGTQTAHAVTIHTGNTTTGSARLTVAANGNVGINNAAPIHMLSVNGTSYHSNNITLIDNKSSNTNLEVYNNNSSGGAAHLRVGYDGTYHLDIFRLGNTADYYYNGTQSSASHIFQIAGSTVLTANANGLSTVSRGIAKASMPPGSILQVQSSTLSAPVTSATTGWVDLGLSVVITPSSSTSKVMITAVVGGSGQTSVTNVQLRLVRDSTAIGVGDASGSDTQCTGYLNQGLAGDLINFCTMNYMDSPASTSAITYKVQFRNNNSSGTVYFNRANGTGGVSYPRTISTITVQEIAQ